MDCPCGNPEGTNNECERCRLIAIIRRLESFGIVLSAEEQKWEGRNADRYWQSRSLLNQFRALMESIE